jgi:beta-phosphoglucomutase
MEIRAVIFDLDGVIVSTDEYHFRAWKKIADEEGIHFDRKINERLRGVSRMESLEILLEISKRPYTPEEKLELANRKNTYYREMLGGLTPGSILPGVPEFLAVLRERGIKIAIASSSRNTPVILKQIGMAAYFDAVADGNGIRRSKPDPEVFLLAAAKLGAEPRACAAVEDAYAGIDAALAAGMKAVGVGYAAGYEKAHIRARDLSCVNIDELLRG